ncbi:proton-coupled zinc antiporter SLC30A1 [Hydra vulgaris]|uniref:Zinc transporter 1 n=1 Tax=Hydra vulgaris TaxID=6087 RepID=T2M2K9_HYDVU|nr:zinc transporter 1-like [Hydra vulgaris]XP_047146413.1 zinc transporter 1-like [Hydra vulgaris]
MGKMRCCQLSQKVSFVSMMMLTTTFFIVEIVVGYLTNSMALVADSFHMLSDVVSLLVGYVALRYSKRGQTTSRYTFGWVRAEVLGALVNAVFLVALCFSILVESFKRIVISEPIENPKLVLLVGGLGLVVNLVGLMLFHQHGHGHSHGGHGHSHDHKPSKKTATHGHSHESPEKNLLNNKVNENFSDIPLIDLKNGITADTEVVQMNFQTVSAEKKLTGASQLNMRGVYLHVLGDALGSVIVMVSALIIIYVNGKWTNYVDPGMSIIMVMIILKTSIPLLKESSLILMQTVPTHIKIQEIQERIVEQVPQVLSIHEFHIWQLAGNKIIASAHVQCNTLDDYMTIANQLKEFFHNEGIHSTTIQPEFLHGPNINTSCILECKEDCAERTCCGEKDGNESPNQLVKANQAALAT